MSSLFKYKTILVLFYFVIFYNLKPLIHAFWCILIFLRIACLHVWHKPESLVQMIDLALFELSFSLIEFQQLDQGEKESCMYKYQPISHWDWSWQWVCVWHTLSCYAVRTAVDAQIMSHCTIKKCSERREHCTLAVVRRSQKYSPCRRPPSRGRGTAKNLI